jgi:hypothetical protein
MRSSQWIFISLLVIYSNFILLFLWFPFIFDLFGKRYHSLITFTLLSNNLLHFRCKFLISLNFHCLNFISFLLLNLQCFRFQHKSNFNNSHCQLFTHLSCQLLSIYLNPWKFPLSKSYFSLTLYFINVDTFINFSD